MGPLRVIIAGTRTITDLSLIYKAVEDSGFEIEEVISGCAKGVDNLGELWAEENGVVVTKFPADWKDLETKPVKIKTNGYGQYNALAGFARNQKMADYADALIAITTGSPGTRDMIDRAKKAGLYVFVKYV